MRHLAGILALVALSACATTKSDHGTAAPNSSGEAVVHDIEDRISRLEREEAERRQRLNTLDAAIEKANADLDVAKKETDMYRCSAKRALIKAEIIGFRSQCVQKQAEYETCVAKNNASSAKGAAFGCIAGLGAALITGGAAAPATLLGCGAGHIAGKSANTHCGRPPNCVQLFNNIEYKMVNKHRLDRIPNCPWNGVTQSGGTTGKGAAAPRPQNRKPGTLAPTSRH